MSDSGFDPAALHEAAAFQSKHHAFMGPPRPWETELAPLLAQLPRVRVKAGEPRQLAAAGYMTGGCHANCRRATSADPTLVQLVGWTETPHVYHLHSVLRRPDGSLHCITPGHTDELGDDGCFAFVVDEAFELEGPGTLLRRGGEYANPIMHALIRKDPSAVAARYEALWERVRQGELTSEAATQLVL